MDLVIAFLKKGSVVIECDIHHIYFRDNVVIIHNQPDENFIMKQLDDAPDCDVTVVTSHVVVLTNVVRVRTYTCQNDITF